MSTPLTTPLPEGITEKEIARYAKLDAGIKKLQPEHKILGEKIKKAFATVGTFIVHGVIIKRTEAKTVDAAAIEKKYPFDLYPEYYKHVLDMTEVPADVKAKFTTKTQRLSVDTAAFVEAD